MGIINRYRMGALRQKQINLSIRRQVLNAHPAYTRSDKALKKGFKEIKKTYAKEAKVSGKLSTLEHMYVAKRAAKEGRKADRRMSRIEAARIAAQARWHGKQGKGGKAGK